MPQYAALDVSQEMTAICLVDEAGHVIGEAKLPTCADAIAAWLDKKATDLARVGLETGPMAVWLWNELLTRALPVICLDARHAHAALKVRPNKTDRNDGRGSRKSYAPAGSSRSRSRPEPATRFAHYLLHATPWCTSGSSLRTRFEVCCAPSECCSAKPSVGSADAPVNSWPVSSRPRL